VKAVNVQLVRLQLDGPGRKSGRPFALGRDRGGVAAVEFAVTFSLLLVLLGGITDFGLVLRARSRVANAVAQGVQYAYLHPVDVTASQIQDVIQKSSTVANVVAVVSDPACYCITGTTTMALTATACGSTCADGSKPGTYVTITATYPYQSILPNFTHMLASASLSETATVRFK
jgi:Flp pilus assembly protein TadG